MDRIPGVDERACRKGWALVFMVIFQVHPFANGMGLCSQGPKKRVSCLSETSLKWAFGRCKREAQKERPDAKDFAEAQAFFNTSRLPLGVPYPVIVAGVHGS